MRSFLADILSDELGCGNPNKAHPHLYDSFLASIGIDKKKLDSVALKNNIELLDNVRNQLMSNSSEFGVGLRGMGGECVCQVYITLLHKYLTLNPYIIKNKDKINWTFWDLHVGDHDIKHREETRKLIHSEIVIKNNASLNELGCAYGKSMLSWENFWRNIFVAAMQSKSNAEFVEVQPTFNLYIQ